MSKKLTAKEQELLAAAKYGLKDFEENYVTETEESLRRSEIQSRYNEAKKRETISAMVQRYRGYGHDITQEGYITNESR